MELAIMRMEFAPVILVSCGMIVRDVIVRLVVMEEDSAKMVRVGAISDSLGEVASCWLVIHHVCMENAKTECVLATKVGVEPPAAK